MTYLSNVTTGSMLPVEVIWARLGAFGRHIHRLIVTAQERRARAFIERYQRDGFCW